jgi:hypothetical protein
VRHDAGGQRQAHGGDVAGQSHLREIDGDLRFRLQASRDERALRLHADDGANEGDDGGAPETGSHFVPFIVA